MRALRAALGLWVLPACLEAPPASSGGDDGGAIAGSDAAAGDEFRKTLTVEAGTVQETLVDFPLLVLLQGDSDLAAHAADDGHDIAFFDEAGAPLAFELESWDGAGNLRAWVRSKLLDGEDTIVYLHYGADTAGSDDEAWGPDFAMVWHLNEAPASIEDSTSGDHHAISVTGATSTMSGLFGNAVYFDGSNDYISFGSSFPEAVDSGSLLTVTGWAKYDEKLPWSHFIAKGTGDNAFGWAIGIDSANDFLIRTMNDNVFARGWSDEAEPIVGTWHHWALVYDGTQETDALRLRGYRDGVEYPLVFDGPIPPSFDAGGGPVYIGCATWNTVDYCIDGGVDEVHVATVARSKRWIEAEHKNQAAGSSFITVGAEEPR